MEQVFADLAGVVSIRAGWFMENYAGLIPYARQTGVLPSMLARLDHAHPMVATQDIGTLVANILLGPRSAEAMSETLAGFNSGHIAFERGQHDRFQGETPLETVLADLAIR
jgi:uncharacterized protein YbjT (DUF2867 family)